MPRTSMTHTMCMASVRLMVVDSNGNPVTKFEDQEYRVLSVDTARREVEITPMDHGKSMSVPLDGVSNADEVMADVKLSAEAYLVSVGTRVLPVREIAEILVGIGLVDEVFYERDFTGRSSPKGVCRETYGNECCLYVECGSHDRRKHIETLLSEQGVKVNGLYNIRGATVCIEARVSGR